MKVTLNSGRFAIEFEGENVKDLFKQIAQAQEVFGIAECLGCGGDNLKFVTRMHDDNEYFELRCADCGAKLAFGVHKKGGTLFPKNWTRWNGQEEQEVTKGDRTRS